MKAHCLLRIGLWAAAIGCALLCISSIGLAASFSLEKHENKERLIFTMLASDGIPGGIARVDPQALVIPFTEVPAGLLFDQTPDNASLVKNTSALGRTLVLHTQTPAFGYVVVKNTPKEIIIDFFADRLGARWKPSGKLAPSTELPPHSAVERAKAVANEPASPSATEKVAAASALQAPTAPANTETKALQDSAPASTIRPAGTGATQTGVASNATIPLPGSIITSPSSRASIPAANATVAMPTTYAEATPPTIESRALGIARAPLVTAASGIPALDNGTQVADNPLVQQPQVLQIPVEPVVGAPAIAAEIPVMPVAPAPVATSAPAPAATPAPAPAVASSPALSLPVTSPKSVPAKPSSTVPATTTVSQVSTTAEGGPHVIVTEHPPVPPTFAERPANAPFWGVADVALPVGSAVFTGPGISYRARFNTKGSEGVQNHAPDPAGAPPGAATFLQNEAGASSIPNPVASEPASSPSSSGGTSSADTPAPSSGGSKELPGGATSSSGEVAPAASEPKPDFEKPEIVYVDEEGNPIPPPLDPELTLPEVREDLNAGRYEEGLEKLGVLLRQNNLTKAHKEEALHLRAELLFTQNKDNFTEHFYKIKEASEQAINFDQSALRNASTRLRLGYMYLKLNNVPEAQAQFATIRRQFPEDENVPLTYYYMGDYYYNKGDIPQAADEFQYVLEKYSSSRFAREAALGLARSFYQMGYYQKAYEITEYIEKRWPRFYLDYPPFLNMMGDVAARLNYLDAALRYYWLYINLEPLGTEADVVLTRIGDIYSQQRQNKAATWVYTKCAQEFGDKDGGLIAKMRLAEATVSDAPTIAGMFSVFDRPYSVSPGEVYSAIIKDYPKSALVPLAELKLAMWYLWKKEYVKALDVCTSFEKDFSKHELMPKIKEVALKAFATMASDSVVEGRYAQMRDIWEKYPIVQEQQEILSPESRIALAVGSWKEGKLNAALETIDPFFLGNKVPKYSEMALELALSIYLEAEQWSAIKQVAEKVGLWELAPATKIQLDYALALADENTGDSDAAAVYWQSLYDSGKLSAHQIAYAAYFLAKDAERKRDWEKAYLLGQDAMSRLTAIVEASPTQADFGKLKSQVASLMTISEVAGRLNEALQYANRYLGYLDAQDPERISIMYRIARIYKRQGNIDEWEKILSQLATDHADDVFGKTAASELKEEKLRQGVSQFMPAGAN